MVKLVAYQAFEGAGVLKINGRLVFIDFPYTLQNEKPITEEQVQRLIIRADFEACNLEFADGPSAIAFLKAKASEGPDPLAKETEESVLEKFNSLGMKNLDGIVDSIGKKYVDRHQYKRAIIGLERIKGLSAVRENPELRLKVAEMLLKCHEELAIAYEFRSVGIESANSSGNVKEKFALLNGKSPRILEDLTKTEFKLVA